MARETLMHVPVGFVNIPRFNTVCSFYVIAGIIATLIPYHWALTHTDVELNNQLT